MKDVEKYYKETISAKPSKLLQKFWNMKLSEEIVPKTAIDLGCGAGNDTIFLLNQGFCVTAVDKERKVIDIIQNRLKDLSQLNFLIEDFEKVELHKTNLILANLSLFFCEPKYFHIFMKKIINNINKNGYFIR